MRTVNRFLRIALFYTGIVLAAIGFALSSVPVILVAGGLLGLAIAREK